MPVLSLVEGPVLIVGWDEVVDWILTHGLRVILVAGLLFAAYLAFRILFPRVVRGVILREKADEELGKRVD